MWFTVLFYYVKYRLQSWIYCTTANTHKILFQSKYLYNYSKSKGKCLSFKRVLTVPSIKILFRLSNKHTLERTQEILGFDELGRRIYSLHVKLKLKDNVPLKKVLCSALYGLDYLIFACPAIPTNNCKIKTISCYKIINENSFYSYNTFFGIILPGNDVGQLFNNVLTKNV